MSIVVEGGVYDNRVDLCKKLVDAVERFTGENWKLAILPPASPGEKKIVKLEAVQSGKQVEFYKHFDQTPMKVSVSKSALASFSPDFDHIQGEETNGSGGFIKGF